jgi:hypothetical protein
MARLTLTPDPTFKLSVSIPVPGVDPVPTEFTFQYRTRVDVLAWLKSNEDKDDADAVFGALAGWGLEDEFDASNVVRLCNVYPGAAPAILGAYLDELRGARAKN